MTKRMLIDATHAEETRVVVVDGTRIEELDFEHQSRKQLRGNIYLAKVTRVEPSLQAAFIEYGGNRHGFLAFNEIHPDYYQIPIADREALLREDAEADAEDHHHERNGKSGRGGEAGEDGDEGEEAEAAHHDDDDVVEEQLERRRRRLMRRYKIQEVLKRRQIMLVQVVKEERGNKGAALTTYLSLAGRYCVLMPNTARGGGISRKITNAADRKKLKSAAQSLDVPKGMGLIIRTAGASRTKAEIKRDYEYLLRLWETIREATLKSIAPALIYEEEDLVKRAIRDMYDKDVDGVLVEGEAGYKEARDFMRMIMPSQAKKIQLYKDPTPLFVRHKVEDQLAQIHQPNVQLRSGGYLVIHQTEALVAIDVNSGKATRERNIEATALKTNMEAAEEAARQLRLRDLAGLIVIDFIDMDESKNNRAVEKKLKDCLADDRARVQMGKISSFGLMEISRQRRRIGVLEGATHVCDHCQGTGRVRSTESAALSALRAIEIEAARGGAGTITLRLCAPVGLYVLNEKRDYLARMDHAMGLSVAIVLDDKLGQADFEIIRTSTREGPPRPADDPAALRIESSDDDDAFEADEAEDEDEDEDDNEGQAPRESRGGSGEARERGDGEGDEGRSRGRGRRRRRRGGRGGGEREDRPLEARAPGEEDRDHDDGEARGPAGEPGEGGEEGEARRRRRRRGRRGGRRLHGEGGAEAPAGSAGGAGGGAPGGDPYTWVHPHAGADDVVHDEDPYAWRDPHSGRIRTKSPPQRGGGGRGPRPERAPVEAAPAPEVDAYARDPSREAQPRPEAEPAPKARRSRSRKPAEAEAAAPEAAVVEPVVEAVVEAPVIDEPAAKPARRSRAKAAPVTKVAPEAEPAPAPEPAPEPEAAPAKAKASRAKAAPAPKPAEPDPAEISTPPSAPRRGWWRR